MLLGKRPRPAMRRTTSMTEISFDLGGVEAPQAAAGNPQQQRHHQRAAPGVDARRQQQQQPPQRPYPADHHRGQQQHYLYQYHHIQGASDGLDTRYLSSMVSPRNSRRNSGDFAVEPANFLRACGLCKRRLGPGKDTFMYRGEVAFCSLECRQQQMNLDERKEKCSLMSMKKEPPQVAAAAEADGETVAAA
ncbi:hypothetical protein Taro_055373 [Colocasia esculenta]|uniref:FLZ-type domain-containing protein n=1 Tax=Colocasia esculenta TaxID=4460 RepID=A0A843XT90_COLES|nr:hypothetical protein [Colocasia esculenta]